MEVTHQAGGSTAAERRHSPLALWLTQAGLVVIAAGAAVGSLGLGIWTPRGPGAGFFPLVLGLGILAFTVVWFVQSLRDADAAGAEPVPMDLRNIGITLGSLLVLAAVLDLVGFIAGMFVFLLFHLQVMGRIGWVKSMVIALIGSVGSFFLFDRFLGVSLPTGSVPPFTWIGI